MASRKVFLPKPERGSLRGWKKKDSPTTRRRALKKRMRREGCPRVLKKLNLLKTISADPGTKRAAGADYKWLRAQRDCRLKTKLGAEVLIELGSARLGR